MAVASVYNKKECLKCGVKPRELYNKYCSTCLEDMSLRNGDYRKCAGKCGVWVTRENLYCRDCVNLVTSNTGVCANMHNRYYISNDGNILSIDSKPFSLALKITQFAKREVESSSKEQSF